VLDTVMLGLGFAGGIIYLAAYFSLTRGWISGTSYLFHATSIFSCTMIAVSSAYSQAWPSAVMNVIFTIVGAIFIAKKVIEGLKSYPATVVDASELSYRPDEPEVAAAA
jgi:hypothetical protein